LLTLALALPIAGVPTVRGTHLAFPGVLARVALYGLGLTLGTMGFAAIASFTGLYFASRHWTDPALALVLFGGCFIVTRLLFADTVNRWDGFRVALVSFIVESAGLFVLWAATTHDVALAGAALSGCGFALVFPALGVEALKTVTIQNHGSALGVHGISRFGDGHHRPDRRIYRWEVRLFGDFPLWLRSGRLRVCDYAPPLSLGP